MGSEKIDVEKETYRFFQKVINRYGIEKELVEAIMQQHATLRNMLTIACLKAIQRADIYDKMPKSPRCDGRIHPFIVEFIRENWDWVRDVRLMYK